MSKKVTAALLAMTALGCRGTPPKQAEEDLSVQALLAAPEQVSIEGRQYTLEAWLQRDFMPSPPPGPDSTLRCYPSVRASGSLQFPAALDADMLWVVNGKDVWKTRMEESDGQHPPNVLARKAWGGPKWPPPGNDLTAVVRLRHKETGQSWLLRASGLGILATH